MEAASDALLLDGAAPMPSSAVRAAKDIMFGSVSFQVYFFSHQFLYPQIAGMVSKVFEHPFDLTKVRLQSQVLDTTARFNGPIDCLVKTWKNEGLRGLYRVCHLFIPPTSSCANTTSRAFQLQ